MLSASLQQSALTDQIGTYNTITYVSIYTILKPGTRAIFFIFGIIF